ncbi:MAG: hypothetical protein AB1768_10905 [Pseudomonadota bacterium]|jgi:hypothetical protein
MTKHFSLILSALALTILGWGVSGMVDVARARSAGGHPAVPDIKPVPETKLTALQDTTAALRQLADHPPAPSSSSGGARLLALPQPGAAGSDEPKLPARRLTLLAESADGRMAVVDGRLVRRGQPLAQGGRIVRIGAGQVIVREQRGNQTLAMDLGRLRVGTIRRGADSAAGEGAMRP